MTFLCGSGLMYEQVPWLAKQPSSSLLQLGFVSILLEWLHIGVARTFITGDMSKCVWVLWPKIGSGRTCA